MYQLTRLSMKNWYLCSCEDVDFRGAIGMVGPTGSGKSSLLDAIQTVIGGANHNRVDLNPSAETKSDRKIIDYCLGYIVPKKDGGVPKRSPSCETILGLTFTEERADGSAHHVGIGVVMTAREGDSREMIVSRFIVPGLVLSARDWFTKEADPEDRPWDDVVAEMKRRCPDMREYRNSAERFVSDMLAVMRRGGQQPDSTRFLDAFFNSLSFEPVNNPTKFVREFILQPHDLSIDRVRAQVAIWRDYADAARAIEEKLGVLKGVVVGFDRWARSELTRVTLEIKRSFALVRRRRLIYGDASRSWHAAVQELTEAKQIKSSLSARLASEEQELEMKKAELAQNGAEGRLAQLDLERKFLNHEFEAVQRHVNGLMEVLRATSNLTTVRDHIPGSFVPIIAAANAALTIITAKPGLEWLKHGVAAISEHLGKLKDLSGLPGRIAPIKEGLETRLTELRRDRDMLQTNVRRAKDGSSSISSQTQEFMRLLKKEGIGSVPLSDVVEVEDESWQYAAEAVLGPGREALIVDPGHVNRANGILYENRNNLHFCRLVKTTRTGEINISHKTGYLSSVFSSNDPHAAADLAYHLGNFQMIETEQDLERSNRGIMRNGKATARLDYQAHKDKGYYPVLGRTARARASEMTEKELDKTQKEIVELQRTLTQLNQASTIAENAANYKVDLAALEFAYSEVLRKNRDIDDRKKAVLSDEDRALAEEVDDLKALIAGRKGEIEDQNNKVITLERAEMQRLNSRNTARTDLRKAVKDKLVANKAVHTEEVRKLLSCIALSGDKFYIPPNPYHGDNLRLKGKPAEALVFYKDAEDEAAEELREMTPDKLTRMAALAYDRMVENYCRKYTVDFGHAADAAYSVHYEWAIYQYRRLEGNELRAYLERTQEAEKLMHLAIKEDVLSRLSDKFGRLDNQLSALNSHLRKHRFTGQVYKFGKKADPKFDKIRKLAIAVKENPDEAQAIIEKRHPEPALREAMTDLEAYLEADGSEELKDYRQYYSFDLYMGSEKKAEEDAEGDETSRGWMSLSARASVGSGGEAQAPFYVAMAASMAMAYFPGGDPPGGPSGMGLVLFDEAFNKLDVPNTQALVRFFGDLGLQLMVAAPEGERPTFTEVFDTMVTVSKSMATETVYIASDFPKERTRQELGTINPNRKGVEGFRAELAEAARLSAAE